MKTNVRSLPQMLRLAEAAAYLYGRGWALVPIVPCPQCGLHIAAFGTHVCRPSNWDAYSAPAPDTAGGPYEPPQRPPAQPATTPGEGVDDDPQF